MTHKDKHERPGLNFGQKGSPRICDHTDCEEDGLFRAPKSPGKLDDHYWFCKLHAREYNAKWDFFKDMNRDEIHAFERDSRTWHRPTWSIGIKAINADMNLEDQLNIFRDAAGFGPAFTRTPPKSPYDNSGETPCGPQDFEYLIVLGLDETAHACDIKEAYKRLVKKYHPDMTGGDKVMQEKFTRVTAAYKALTNKKQD